MISNIPGISPLARAAAWIEDARAAGAIEPDAMALATSSAVGAPSVRVVLCRGIDEHGLRFFTNYESRKGVEIAENPRAAAAFHWPALGRQLRVEGGVERLPEAESNAYFASRPRAHQLSARVSPQSRPIASFEELEQRAALEAKNAGTDEISRPPSWGGYRLVARAVEFWVQGPGRLHQRIFFELNSGVWIWQHLAP